MTGQCQARAMETERGREGVGARQVVETYRSPSVVQDSEQVERALCRQCSMSLAVTHFLAVATISIGLSWSV